MDELYVGDYNNVEDEEPEEEDSRDDNIVLEEDDINEEETEETHAFSGENTQKHPKHKI